MALLAFCSPCQAGEHERHYEVVQPVPEGVLGGVRCPCKGECVESNRGKVPSHVQSLLDVMGRMPERG